MKDLGKLKEDLHFEELEDRLEMVHLAAADTQRCNGSCSSGGGDAGDVDIELPDLPSIP